MGKIVISDFIKNRRSPVAFDPEKSVSKDMLVRLFEAARWAPSSYNEQPWRFIFVTKDNPSDFERLLHCLAEENQEWAKNAPVLILTIAKKTSSYSGKQNFYAKHDLGMAVGAMLAESTTLGLVAHQMGGYDRSRATEVFYIPEDYEPVAVMALGFQGNPETLSPSLQQREKGERVRKSLNEIVYSGSWGNAL